jgi:hypothetical protein
VASEDEEPMVRPAKRNTTIGGSTVTPVKDGTPPLAETPPPTQTPPATEPPPTELPPTQTPSSPIGETPPSPPQTLPPTETPPNHRPPSREVKPPPTYQYKDQWDPENRYYEHESYSYEPLHVYYVYEPPYAPAPRALQPAPITSETPSQDVPWGLASSPAPDEAAQLVDYEADLAPEAVAGLEPEGTADREPTFFKMVDLPPVLSQAGVPPTPPLPLENQSTRAKQLTLPPYSTAASQSVPASKPVAAGRQLLPSNFPAVRQSTPASKTIGAGRHLRLSSSAAASGVTKPQKNTAAKIAGNLTNWVTSPPSNEAVPSTEADGSSGGTQPPEPSPHVPDVPPMPGSYLSPFGGQSNGGIAPLILLGVLATGLVVLNRNGKYLRTFCEVPKMSSALLTPLERPG